ncbi:PAS domain S-box protein [Leptolyngbya sp. FACHB-261]|uniref:PAS domain S-box protein n=1 Tax=Leptolyngbya sp. FACHB-261 TaxID=2692806 RepID=UPI0016886D41|nr:PAS domain S-box protein [Leptolyngbya sp. FACHB-261]MBD2101369.1 PAS domain S-box protein [Leptolyngbya sp. FACHB-261]
MRSWPRHTFLSSLRARLVLLVLLAVIPALGLVLHSASMQRRYAESRVRENLLRYTKFAAANQKQATEGTRQLLIALSELPQLREGNADCNRLLAKLLENYPAYTGFGVVDAKGNWICSAPLTQQQVNVADRSYFQLARDTRDFAIGEYQIGRVTGKATLNFGYPILNEAGQVQSLVIAALDLAWLEQLAAEVQLPEGSIVTVVDRKGTILVRHPDSQNWVGKAVPNAPMTQAVLSQTEGTTEAISLDGVKRLYAFTALGNDPVNRDVHVRIGIPQAIAFAGANQLLVENLISLGAVTILALAAAWVGGDVFLIQKVKSLVKTTQQLRRGDLSARTGFENEPGELGQLARAFDEMAETLEHRGRAIATLNRDLQNRVDELQTLFEMIPIGILMTQDPKFEQVKANPAFAKILGFSTENNVSYTPSDSPRPAYKVFQNGKQLDADELPLRYAAIHQVELKDIEVDIVRGDGAAFNLFGYAVPLLDEQGHCRGSLAAFLDITERKRIEAALSESEDHLRSALSAADMGTWRVDLQTNQDRRDANLNRILGLEAQMSTQPLDDFMSRVHPEDRAQVARALEQNLREQGLYDTEIRIVRPDGTVRWLRDRGRVVCNQNGEPVYLTGAAVDITDRKQAEVALRQSESRLRLMIDSAKDYAIFTLDLNGTIVSWNSGAERLLGYPEAEAIGCNSRLIFTPEDKAQGQAEWERQTTLTQGRAENERWHIRKDGSCFWASGLLMPLQDEAGNVQGFVKILQDRTAQRQANERFQLLYDTTSDLLATEQPLALMHNLFSKLSAQLELHCYYNFLVEEKDGRQILHLKNYEGVSEEVAQSIEWIEFGEYLCGSAVQEHRQIVLDQAQIASHPHAQFIYSLGITAYACQPLIAQGRSLGSLSFGSFTRTHFTREEIDLLQSTCDQIAIAIDRTNLIASIQQQAEQLRQASRIKDEFLAVLSHELRSPLNPILGWSRLLQTRKLDAAKTAIALATIERNAKLQSELIEDLLDVSRILQGKLSLNVTPINLAATIRAALETVRLAAEAKAIEVEVSLDANVSSVSGDATRLQQVVWNLVSNAVKFTPSGGRVEVRLVQAERQAQITVRDNGKGIPAEFLPYVFDYFRQADSATTRKFGGLGLGLAIVRHLVELHGGTVEADSPGEGLGATFTVRLPLLPLGSADDQTEQSSQSLPSLQGVQVLVVDDDTDTREFVTFLLEQYGAQVTNAASAQEALVALTQSKPDVLVSDIGMPEMDGYTLLRQVRALPLEQGGQIPAIALTAYAGEMNQQQALQAGFQKHISKPVEPDLLVASITALIGREQDSK